MEAESDGDRADADAERAVLSDLAPFVSHRAV
jgi:hypothetical protein